MIKNSLYKFSIFATLFLIIIIDEMSYGIIAPVLSSFVMDNQSIHLLSYHFNIAGRDLLYASLLGTVSLFLFISAPILGDISDAFGRKKTLLFMIAFSAVSYFVCALGVLLKNIPLLFVGHAAVGFTAGTASISQAAITDVSHHEEKVYNLSIITLALCFGFIAGPLIGGFFTTYPLSHSIGYASAYLIVTFLAIINVAMITFFLKETHTEKAVLPKIHWNLGFKNLLEAFQDKRVQRIVFILLFFELCWAIYFQYTPLFLIQMFQYSAEQVGFFMSYIGLLITIGLVFIMRILLRFLKIYWLIWFALIIIILGILYMLSFEGEWSYIIGAIPVSLGIGICYTALITRLSNAVEEDFQGWAMGVGMAITAFAWFFGAIIIGFTAPIHEKLPLLLCGVFTCMSLAISLLRKP